MNRRVGMRGRLLLAALTRRPGMVALAVTAVAIGASVASALLHVSGDVTRKLTRELRALGPNLVLLPDETAGALLDLGAARARLAALGIVGAARLDFTARSGPHAVPVSGVDAAFAALHPSWRWTPAAPPAPADGEVWIGARLARRLGLGVGDRVNPATDRAGRSWPATVTAVFESGTADDERLLLPLDAAQWLTANPGAASAVEARLAGDAADARRVAAALEIPGARIARVRLALSSAEAGLLDRMRRLMALVTIAALVSAGLCAFGTLTDLALERRREIGLLAALGATRAEIARQFALESLAIGVAGGALGWALGAGFAQVIGQRVFGAWIALGAGVPLAVTGLGVLVASLAGLGAIRLALRVDPARVLKGD